MPPKPKSWEIRFPAIGVDRRRVYERAQSAVSYPCPWSSNVRLQDPIARRLRGGSRGGLTKLTSDDYGTTIADMVPINVSSSGAGAEELLVVLVDSSLTVLDSGSTSIPTGKLITEAGVYIITEAGDNIILSTADAQATGFLVAGQQHAWSVDSSNVYKFDPKTGQLITLTASGGTIPTGCTFGAVYRDRLVLGGGDNAIYMSQQGDFANFDFGKDISNAGRAIVFQLSHPSKVGRKSTAMIPHDKGDHLLCATAKDLWIVSGDPAMQGSLDRVHPHVGIVSSRAWCKVVDWYAFLAEDGLYKVNADGSGLEPLTEDRIPDELRNVDTSTYTVLMGYDHDNRAIHIYVPTTSGALATDTHWLFELEGGQFWPMHVQTDHSPLAICEYGHDLVLGCADGYTRKTSGSDDDGTSIESHLLIGPLRLGDAHNEGIIETIHGVIGESSGTVYWRIVIAETAEKACDNGKTAIEAFQAGTDYDEYVWASGAWDAGRSETGWPQSSGMWACIWLQSTAEWAFEAITMESKLFGRWRDG